VPVRRVVAYGEWEMDPNPPSVPREPYSGPRRDDAVAVWLKRKRDTFERETGVDTKVTMAIYLMLDGLLDDYRLHADIGAPLSTPTDELEPHGPGGI
jgi:hypothetical protein